MQQDNLNGLPGKHSDILSFEQSIILPWSGEFGAVLDVVPQMIWSARADGHFDYGNRQWHQRLGLAPQRTNRIDWAEIIHSDDWPILRIRWEECLSSGDPFEAQFRLRDGDGAYCWVLARAQALRSEGGEIVRWFGTLTDIDEIKQAAEQREIVLRELSHRIRNIFAVVNSLLMLSSRNRPEAREFAEGARERIDSLARAHEYIHPQPYGRADAASLMGLLGTLLQPYGEGPDGRIILSGPDIPIGISAATSLALVIHELATNAAKHGSLSLDSGVVRISTEITDSAVLILWQERGGPLIASVPQRKGFGTSLSDRALQTSLASKMEREWDPGGMIARIRIPMEKLMR